MTLTATEVWRDYETDGVPGSGAHKPVKAEARAWGTWLEGLLKAGVTGLAYATLTALNADLAHAANSTAMVYDDPVAANNGIYQKSGASGAGSWARIGDLPGDVVPLIVTGGTGNAIIATAPETPTLPGGKLYLMTPTANNTGATTIAVNGASAVAIKNAFGSSLASGSLINGSQVLMAWQTDHYQLLISAVVDGSAILADAVNARDASIAARDAAQIYAASAAIISCADRTALKAVDTSVSKTVLLREGNREGMFVWKSGNYSTLVTGDPNEGVYIKASAIATSAGAWERVLPHKGEYDVKWFGATGDNVTDDAGAIQACINFAALLSGGDVVLSQGGYAIGTGLTISTPLIRLRGVGMRYCSLRALSAEISIVSITAARCGIEGISIFNQALSASQNGLIFLGSGAVQCVIQDLDLVGGWNCILVSSGCVSATIRDVVAREATGGQIVDIYGQFITLEDCIWDQDWPVTVPSSSNFKGARANSTAYSVGDVLTVSGVYLQCRIAGTTGGSAPSLQFYESDITDGTVKWRLVNLLGSCAVRINTGAFRVRMINNDHTGSFENGIHITDTLGGNDPYEVMMSRCESSGIINFGIMIDVGSRITIENCEFNQPVGNSTTRSGIVSNAVGDLSIIGCRFASGFDRGIWLGAGRGTIITSCHIFATTGVRVESGVNDVAVIGNNFASASWGSCTTSVILSGSNNRYVVRGNLGTNAGATINDSGGGATKDVAGNT
ncbi:right-handed parallel beta-helix repeat-containing protein [Bradyrhizobium sp. SZCCHNRI2007]|uniref:right-handed parallel beta-helix repeat-containing protein n=1 Tax=Bradyrhizobium sp. SZCCHNRI2007 TaxID=3057281 RepID=UPI0028E80335|nr:right-handed parallel beta-helix repeat-containing protein [Bradyrhizobium sp. SZCCHNRI2007]